MRSFLIKYFIRVVVKLISAQTRIYPRMCARVCIMYNTVSLRSYVKPFNIIKVPKENTMKHFGRIVAVNHG